VYSLAKTLQAVFGEATSSSAGRFRPGGKEFVLRLGLPTLDAALAAALETDARNRPDTHQLLCAAGVFLKR
jgi:hypothetical protein